MKSNQAFAITTAAANRIVLSVHCTIPVIVKPTGNRNCSEPHSKVEPETFRARIRTVLWRQGEQRAALFSHEVVCGDFVDWRSATIT